MEQKYIYWIALAGLFIVILLLLFRPLPTIEGAWCDEVCTYKIVPVEYFDQDNISAEDICGPGCLIEDIWWDPGSDQYIVKCTCCDCELIGGEEGLPDCKNSGLFGYVYAWLGWCEFKE